LKISSATGKNPWFCIPRGESKFFNFNIFIWKEVFMEDIHKIFTKFKKEFPRVYSDHEALGREIHDNSGPLPEKIRWLIKIAVSGASQHPIALETHIMKAKEAGVSDDEIKHTLLLLIQTTGFPTFMEAYSVFKKMRRA
jgi:alkylhydroperoxidase/carboxymuconolactone decarboxylase family protein YurZ